MLLASDAVYQAESRTRQPRLGVERHRPIVSAPFARHNGGRY